MWFTAEILFKSTPIGKLELDAIWENRVVLFQAVNEEEARIKATAYGRLEGHKYLNHAGELVVWEFDAVENICQLDGNEFSDGKEVFWRFLRHSEVLSLRVPFPD